MSIFSTIGKLAGVGAALGVPGAGAVSAGATALAGGAAGGCPNQVPTEAVIYMLSRATQAEKEYLSAAWPQSVKGTQIPWSDPWKLAQQAAGGNGCKLSGDDHYWANAFNLILARYPRPASTVATIPAAVGGVTSPPLAGSSAVPVSYVAPAGGDTLFGVPVWLVAVIAAGAVLLFLRRRK